MTPRSYRKYELARDKFYEIVSKDKGVSAITSTVIAMAGVSGAQAIGHSYDNDNPGTIEKLPDFPNSLIWVMASNGRR